MAEIEQQTHGLARELQPLSLHLSWSPNHSARKDGYGYCPTGEAAHRLDKQCAEKCRIPPARANL
jgi:hypothetical protein